MTTNRRRNEDLEAPPAHIPLTARRKCLPFRLDGGAGVDQQRNAGHMQLGEAYLAAGRLAPAREAFDKALATFARGETPAAMVAETMALRDRAAEK
jgi:hypothetical protein